MEVKKQILKLCIERGFLIDKEILEILAVFNEAFSSKIINHLFVVKIKERVINRSVILENSISLKSVFQSEEERGCLKKFFSSLNFSLEDFDKISAVGKDVKILSSARFDSKKIDVEDFVNHFRNRYNQIKDIIEQKGIVDLKSIRRIGSDGESQNLIVMIYNKRVTKNRNLIFEVEDITGSAKVVVNNNKKDLYNKCKDILPDEVVCFNVSGNREILFANDVIFPDCFLKQKEAIQEDVCVAFSSDIHIGSKMFLEEPFLRFIRWINGEYGNEEERKLAKRVKYLFLIGDNIDGVGVYPGQEDLLTIPGVLEQYKKLEEYLRAIRKDIKIIISPGQHDAVWVGEPQRSLDKEWAQGVLEMDNVLATSNPCLVELEGKIKVLTYHGASFHGMVDQIPEIRINYGHNNPTIVLKELLKNRHLAPMHGECDYIPTEKKDYMVIDPVPDVVATGDWHRPEVSEYNNILLITSSCWQSITPFGERVGKNPDPCKVPVLNLKTREVKILDFSMEDKK